ncbi:MAG: winged helix DNA-binding domain-containing protein [Actinomycetota bacterium]|nr:winged helix DNA-binding domain-containing protein [Actinomycetota bacterium]
MSLAQARRLAVAGTLLDGSLSGSARILDVVRKIGYLQLDPTNAVARSHLLVLFSRLGTYDTAKLEQLLAERKLYEYSAAIVPADEYRLHLALMRRFPHMFRAGYPDTIERWLADNAALRESILTQLRERGPLPSREVVDVSDRAWKSTGWTNDRNVTRMLELLWAKGEVLVHGRQSAQRLWALPEQVLPPAEPAPLDEVERHVALRSLRGLGVATGQQVREEPFVGGPFYGLDDVVRELDGVEPVEVEGQKGTWYAHRDDLKLLDRPEPEPHTTLLSPFDPLIRHRKRTKSLWDFDFRLEIYVPKEKRWGFFVLPVLHGNDLVGRIDPTMDRKAGVLRINRIKWEPGAPRDVPLETTVGGLAEFLGAERVKWPRSKRRP